MSKVSSTVVVLIDEICRVRPSSQQEDMFRESKGQQSVLGTRDRRTQAVTWTSWVVAFCENFQTHFSPGIQRYRTILMSSIFGKFLLTISSSSICTLMDNVPPISTNGKISMDAPTGIKSVRANQVVNHSLPWNSH